MEIIYGVLITLAVLVGILLIGAIIVIAVGLNAYFRTESSLDMMEKPKRNKR
jgi:hypothetical protein